MLDDQRFPLPPLKTGNQPQVFLDPRRRRILLLKTLGLPLVILCLLWVGTFFWHIIETRIVEVVESSTEILDPDRAAIPDAGPDLPPALFLDEFAAREQVDTTATPTSPPCGSNGKAVRNGSERMRVFAFLPTAPDGSFLSLPRSCGQIDVLLPEWITVNPRSLLLDVTKLDPDAEVVIDAQIRDRGMSLQILPTVRLDGDRSAPFWTQLDNPEMTSVLIDRLLAGAKATKAAGLCLDILPRRSGNLAAANRFLSAWGTAFHLNGLSTCLVLDRESVGAPTAATLATMDHVVVRAFEEPWIGSPAAPLAPDEAFELDVQKALTLIDPEKLVIAAGAFATDWVSGRPMPEKIPFAEAMTRITTAGSDVSLAKQSRNSFSSLVDSKGQRHQIWMLDAASLHNQLKTLTRLGVRNVALSDLGFEDPGVWPVLQNAVTGDVDLVHRLRNVHLDGYVSYTGDGPFLRYQAPLKVGRRSVEFDAMGHIAQLTYQQIPAATRVERFGRAAPDQIVLTFDDGPHPEYTPAILDVLQAEGVPATFFVVGNASARSPELISRILDEGHELGSHTYMHPRMAQISTYRAVVEVNSVQKLINTITGRGMMLYREPFMRGDGPLSAQAAEPLRLLNGAGYIVAGSEIVPVDWQDNAAAEIAEQVLSQVREGKGNVIVLHDGGSDRSQTVAAVPLIIAGLREQGYVFTTMADILGLSRESVMPEIAVPNALMDGVSFSAIALGQRALIGVFWVAIAIGLFRSLSILFISFFRRRSTVEYSGTMPSAAIIIPAFNEAVVIVKSVQAALNSSYPRFSVVVVDDGSTDETLSRLRSHFEDDPRVRILTQPNRGKWAALNHGISVTNADIAVCIDADTQIDPKALMWLCRHFSDPKIGAVAGKVRVGNRTRLLARLQALEYTTAQNIDRWALERLNAMLVVPGAIGAWRVSAVRKVEGYSSETLSEDADLTVSVLRDGYRIGYEEKAIATTEAPARIRPFLQQRLRWSLGMLQVGWKHKRAIIEGRSVGLVSIFDLAIFGYLFPLIAPLADLLFFWYLYDLISVGWTGPVQSAAAAPSHLFLGYLALPLIDLMIAAISIKRDDRESWWMLLLFPFQRIFYRQLLYYSVYRSLARAATGKLAKWQKAERFGLADIGRVR